MFNQNIRHRKVAELTVLNLQKFSEPIKNFRLAKHYCEVLQSSTNQYETISTLTALSYVISPTMLLAQFHSVRSQSPLTVGHLYLRLIVCVGKFVNKVLYECVYVRVNWLRLGCC